MNHFYSLVLIVVASFASASCASSSLTPTFPSSVGDSTALTADLLACPWKLRSIQVARKAEEATPPGTNYTLTFTDGRLSTRVDCNVCSGGFALSGETLTAGPALACTRAACPTMAFENAYTSVLGGDSTVTLSDGTLVLSASRGVVSFTRYRKTLKIVMPRRGHCVTLRP